MQELPSCEAAEMQEDLRLVRAPAALGAAAACAARSRLRFLSASGSLQQELQDQAREELQDEEVPE